MFVLIEAPPLLTLRRLRLHDSAISKRRQWRVPAKHNVQRCVRTQSPLLTAVKHKMLFLIPVLLLSLFDLAVSQSVKTQPGNQLPVIDLGYVKQQATSLQVCPRNLVDLSDNWIGRGVLLQEHSLRQSTN